MDALGYAEAKIDQHVIDISYDDTPALIGGDPPGKPLWKEIVSRSRFSIKSIFIKAMGSSVEINRSDGRICDFNKSECAI